MERKALHAAQRNQRKGVSEAAMRGDAVTPQREAVLHYDVEDDSPPQPSSSNHAAGDRSEYPPTTTNSRYENGRNSASPASLELLREDLLAKDAELARSRAEIRMLKAYLLQERARRTEAVASAQRVLYSSMMRIFRAEGIRGVESRRDELLTTTAAEAESISSPHSSSNILPRRQEKFAVTNVESQPLVWESSPGEAVLVPTGRGSAALADLRRKEALQLQATLMNSARRRYQHALAS